jgi:anti-sigma factor RsiW
MIACVDAERLIEARIDGLLTTAEARALDAHLAGCPACAGQLEAETALDAALRARFGRVQAPPSLAVRVRVEVAEEAAQPRRAWLVDALNATGALLVISVAIPAAALGGMTGVAAAVAALAVGLYPLLLVGLAEDEPAGRRHGPLDYRTSSSAH